MKALILTYHSHHLLGPEYGVNDHVAFPRDLEALAAAGYRIVSLATLVDEIMERGLWRRATSSRVKIVALTFDDGPEYDAVDFEHPALGPQPSFLTAMRRFRDSSAGRAQTETCATSFVIASPEARLVMETSFDPTYTFLQPGAMNDRWWNAAIDSRMLSIANHSWDHLHPALPAVAHSRQAKADFAQVDNDADADAQIHQAALYLRQRTQQRDAPFFAYPFGHTNPFLTDHYLPQNAARNRLRAAFTTEPRPAARGDNVWSLPRYTCGHHWKTPDEFQRLLAGV